MRRHCGRPGCNAVATATFSFDATRCVVWLNPIEDGMPRAGDLCTRHADGMAPPKGWERVDHRIAVVAEPSTHAGKAYAASGEAAGVDDLLPAREPVKRNRKPPAKKRWHEVPNLFAEPSAAVVAPVASVALPVSTPTELPTPIAPAAASPTVEGGVVVVTDEASSWMPRYATDEDLGGVLDASTPLLSRAFNHARPSEGASDDASDEASEGASDRRNDIETEPTRRLAD